MSYTDLVEKNKEKTLLFIKKNLFLIIIIFIVTISVIFYFTSIYRRIPRYLKSIKYNLKELEIRPIKSCPELIKKNYKLCDFYISSSAKSYLPCQQYYDYSSIKMIELAILNGARYIELDIFNKGFCPETIPVVTNGTQPGNWHWTTELSFEDCCDTIANYAFSSLIPNGSDPFFIYLNLNTDYNCSTVNKVAETLRTYFKGRLLNKDYSYQRKNIGMVNIQEFLDKTIILANDSCKGTDLNELINLNLKGPFLRSYNHYEIESLYEPKEVIEFNKRNLTRVFPAFPDRITKNYNPRGGWLYGCQFCAVNFSQMDDNLRCHFLEFNKSSFILKPYQLRYHKESYKRPIPQSKKVSFAPEQITTPYYSITY